MRCPNFFRSIIPKKTCLVKCLFGLVILTMTRHKVLECHNLPIGYNLEISPKVCTFLQVKLASHSEWQAIIISTMRNQYLLQFVGTPILRHDQITSKFCLTKNGIKHVDCFDNKSFKSIFMP